MIKKRLSTNLIDFKLEYKNSEIFITFDFDVLSKKEGEEKDGEAGEGGDKHCGNYGGHCRSTLS